MASSSNRPASAPTFSSPFPFATAPDIIRAHQKDAYFQGLLTTQLTDLHRRLFGVRSSHVWANESRTATELLYLCITTLLGNRTLGEEYCDLVQVEELTPAPAQPIGKNPPLSGGPRLPTLRRRGTYITLSILLPYALSRLLPSLRARLRARLETRLATLHLAHKQTSRTYRVQRYILAHLVPLSSGAHLHAAVLASFYFSGAYYSLSKRVTRLRYVFTRRLPQQPPGGVDNDDRAGYEVLGVLLLVQLAVQGYLHIRQTLRDGGDGDEAGVEAAIRERAWGPSGVGQVRLDLEHSHDSGNNDLLLNSAGTVLGGAVRDKIAVGRMAHTPVPKDGAETPRFDLRDEKVLGWIKGRSQRKCTLCLDELRDPSATGCGHVFCWSCIGDWVREKPECPLCRREVMIQHILPLRMM